MKFKKSQLVIRGKVNNKVTTKKVDGYLIDDYPILDLGVYRQDKWHVVDLLTGTILAHGNTRENAIIVFENTTKKTLVKYRKLKKYKKQVDKLGTIKVKKPLV